jgi:hypothetical protein
VDLFVGGRVVPGATAPRRAACCCVNDGRGRFTDVTERLAPELARVGMVTDAVWRDVDGDGRPDLVVVGEWMPITVFRNAGGGRLARARGARARAAATAGGTASSPATSPATAASTSWSATSGSTRACARAPPSRRRCT